PPPPAAPADGLPYGAADVRIPPLLVGGANGHSGLWDDVSVAVGIDWLRLTGPRERLDVIRALIRDEFGPGEEGGGRYFYKQSERHLEGVAIMYDPDEPGMATHCCVELPGKACTVTTQERLRALLWAIMWEGFSCKRIDLRADFRSEDKPVGLWERMRQSCRAGEMCGARRHRSNEEEEGDVVVGRTLYMGKRGDEGSGRFGRCYDKGLETGEARIGEWERYEVEFTGDCAVQVARALFEAGENVSVESWRLLIGAFEFREKNGQKRSRRPLVEWYADLLGGVDPVQVRERRKESTLQGFRDWLDRCVKPTLEDICVHGGLQLEDVWRDLMADSLLDAVPDAELADDLEAEARPIVWAYLVERGFIDKRGKRRASPLRGAGVSRSDGNAPF
ncbi:MAG: replication initiation factor domain-containing protein, partial [Phycisphaeraceae bacterium]